MGLEGTYLLTGGARGIGRELALLLAQRGIFVHVLDIEPGKDTERIAHHQVDLTDTPALREACAHIGTIDGLIGNAGIMRRGTIYETSEDDYDALFAVNLKANAMLLKHADIRKSGLVLFTSSRHATSLPANPGIYALTKSSLLSLARLIEHTRPDLTVKIACPGPVATQMAESHEDTEAHAQMLREPRVIAEMIVELIESPHRILEFIAETNSYRTI